MVNVENPGALVPLADKHLFQHIFYVNMANNFCYDFKWPTHTKRPDYIPEEFHSNIPFLTIDNLWECVTNETVFVIGSGPSLDKNIDYFCENYKPHMGRVLACDGAIHSLEARGFKPDWVITSEADGQHNRGLDTRSGKGIRTTDLLLYDENMNVRDLSFWNDVPLIACTWVNSEFRRLWPNDEIYYYVNFDQRYERFWGAHQKVFPLLHGNRKWPVLRPRISAVGFHAIDFCRHLGSKRCVLLGNDMQVYTQKDHHCKDFNLTWEDSSIDLVAHYQRLLMTFLTGYGGKFGIETINCTEGGALNEGNTDCTVMSLKEYMNGTRT